MTMLGGYLIVSGALFTIGLFGLAFRRNLVAMLISVEFMLTASNISLAAFSHLTPALGVRGDAFALFVMVAAAAEVAVGLAMAIAVAKRTGRPDIDGLKEMKG